MKITIRTVDGESITFHQRVEAGTWGMVDDEKQIDWKGRWALDYADTLKTVGATVRFISLSGLLIRPPEYLQIHERQDGGDQPNSPMSIYARWSGDDIPQYVVTGEITEIIKDKEVG